MLFKKVICLCISEFIYYFSLIQVKIHYTFYRQQVHAQSSAAEHSATSLISHQPALHAYSVYNITLAIRISVMLSTNFIWWMLDYRDQGCKYITYIAYFCVVYKRVCISFGLGVGGGGRALSPIDLLPVWNESAWRVWSMHTISQT